MPCASCYKNYHAMFRDDILSLCTPCAGCNFEICADMGIEILSLCTPCAGCNCKPHKRLQCMYGFCVHNFILLLQNTLPERVYRAALPRLTHTFSVLGRKVALIRCEYPCVFMVTQVSHSLF